MSKERENSIDIDAEEFKEIGYKLIDTISSFIKTISERPVTTEKSPQELQKIIGNLPLPENARSAEELLSTASG